MSQKRLFLLDAYALIFRGYYAFIKNPRINSKGMDTSAIMGFMNSLMDVIKREKPDHLAVAFDKGGSDYRFEMYQEYKAHRDETPEAIKIAVPYIQELLKAMHIPIIEKAGFEADDLIGTLAKQAEKEGFQVFMVTPDKDFAQLVSENIFMYKPARMGNDIEIWGIPEVLEKFEIERPEQVIDFLGMMGDSADNIPGLPGVGEKTAKKFLAEYGTLENLLANTHQLKGAMKDKIEANKELGILSKKLATILLDCPVNFDANDYELSKPDVEKTDALFQELEFRQMKAQFDKLFGTGKEYDEIDSNGNTSEIPQPTKKAPAKKSNEDQFDLFGFSDESDEPTANHSYYATLENTTHFYQIVQGDLPVKLLMQNLLNQTSVCFDTETTGIDALNAELVGMSFSFEKGKGFYVPFPKNQEEAAKFAQQYKDDRALFRKNLRAAYDALISINSVNAKKIVVMGYCFGGTGALELARSGVPLAGTVSFHGGLSNPTPADAKNIKGPVLIMHGAEDPFVPPAEVAAFKDEMKNANISYEFIEYPGAVHAFTNPQAGNDKSKGAAYNRTADRESWEAFEHFLKENLAN